MWLKFDLNQWLEWNELMIFFVHVKRPVAANFSVFFFSLSFSIAAIMISLWSTIMVVATIIVDHSIWKKEPSTKKDIIFDSSNVSYSIIRNTNGGGWSSSSLQSVDDEKNVRWIWIIKPWPFSSSSSSLSCCHNYDYYYHLVSYNDDALMFKVLRMMSKIREKIFFSVFTYNIRWNPLLLLLVVVHPFLRANGRCVYLFVCAR